MGYKRVIKGIENIAKKGTAALYRTQENKFTRNRKMGQADLAWYLTLQKGRTSSVELDEYLKVKNGTYKISISKQAFSKQRQYLKPEIFIDINHDYMEDFYHNYPEDVKKYKDHYVCAIDGSMFELPNTRELREEYQSPKNNTGSRESARARVSGIYDVENGFFLDGIIASCKEGERPLALKNIAQAGTILDLHQTILIFDRGYPDLELIYALEKLQVKYVFRLPPDMYKKERGERSTADEWVNVELHSERRRYVSNKEWKEELRRLKKLSVRITDVPLERAETEYLLSNISEEMMSAKEMKEVYFKRWQIEIGYDILKNKLEIENFTGRTKITIEQDFHAQLYTFNVLQDIKEQTNERVKEKQRGKDLKYEYKPNVNILAGWLKNILIAVMFAETEAEKKDLYNIIIEKAEKNLVPIKPDRKYERKRYKGANKYRTNLRKNV